MGILEYSSTAASNTTINGIGIAGSSSAKNGDDALRQLMADTASAITKVVDKTGTYTALKTDFNQMIRATGTLTLNLTAAATLTAGWCLWVKADGGAVTIDPNSTEQINGATTLALPDGFAAFVVCTGTAFRAIVFGNGDVTLAGTQTLLNKTLTTPTITLKQSATPTPTAEGDIQWDTDDNVIAIGDGAATRLFLPIPASTAAGDLEYYTAAKVTARLAKGIAGQVLTMNAGATAPEWGNVDYGAGNAALAYGATGTYMFGYIDTTSVIEGSTYAGSALYPAGITTDSAIAADGIAGDGLFNPMRGVTALAGTWRAMGRVNNSNTQITLFMRIS